MNDQLHDSIPSSLNKSIHEEIKSRLQSSNLCHHSVQNLSSRLLSKNIKVKKHKTIISLVVLMGVKLSFSC
jgi:hypothetical protein